MRVRFFGTRGSIPTPGPKTLRYGGNTSCVEIRSNAGTLVLIDMGTGAAVLGNELMAQGKTLRGHVLISHTHWDHIQGIPFFAPFRVAGDEWDIYAPRGLGQSLRDTLAGQMQYTYFPVSIEQLGATIHYHDLVEGRMRLGDIEVTARYLNHPALTLGYRLEADGVAVVYACDHEPHSRALAVGPGEIEGEDRHHAEFLTGADLVIHDAQYVASEYGDKIGWGHSTVEYAREIARFAGVKRLALTHHDPQRDDAALDALVARLRKEDARGRGPEIFAAAEGQVIEFSARPADPTVVAGFPAQAKPGPALIDGSVLLAMATPSKADELEKALGEDDIRVLSAAPGDALAVAASERPTLVVLEDSADGSAADTCAALRRLPDYGTDLPIVLVTANEDPSAGGERGFTDRLVEPYSPHYARTRFHAWLMRSACRWLRAPKPADEEGRLAATRALGLLDTPPEERFERITRLVAALFDAPIALISLMDADRQWYKSVQGLDLRETRRDEAFCAHTVASGEPLIVSDALFDERFADNPYVAGAPRVRFYAGQPLILSNGFCVGTLCVIDTRPRHLDAAALRRLRDMAELTIREMERAG